MASFDIIRYMSSLTGYVFDDAVLERIALERNVAEVGSFAELSEKDKDGIHNLMMRLYQKWDDPKVKEVEEIGGGLEWMQ